MSKLIFLVHRTVFNDTSMAFHDTSMAFHDTSMILLPAFYEKSH